MMNYHAIFFPLLAIYQQVSAEITSFNAEKHWNFNVTCHCSYPEGRHCPKEGICDAAIVGRSLLAELADAKTAVIQGDRQKIEKICSRLFVDQPTDVLLQEFEAWIPACVRVPYTNFRACSLAPPRSSLGAFTHIGFKNLTDTFHRFLHCSNETLIREKQEWHYCRDSNLCNVKPKYLALKVRSGNDKIIPNLGVFAALFLALCRNH